MTVHQIHKNRIAPGGGFSFAPKAPEPLADQINALIDAALEDENSRAMPRGYLGGSRLGVECHRRLGYEYFKAVADSKAYGNAILEGEQNHRTPHDFKGKTIRRFRMGHMHEVETAAWLRSAGFLLATEKHGGGQFGFAVAPDEMGEPRLSGHIDGRIDGGPVPMPYPVLWEHKIMKAEKWRACMEKTVRVSHPEYYFQCQIYMAYMDLGNALFTALNTDTSQLIFELLPFDYEAAQWASDRGVRVLEAERPEDLPRIAREPTDYRCRFCSFKDRCWQTAAAEPIALAKPAWLSQGS